MSTTSTTTTGRVCAPAVTPWGPKEDEREVLPGVWWVTTAGHGGYWLRGDRVKQVGKVFPSFRQSWFEEDCEWAIVDLALQSEIVDEAAIHHAVETVLMCAGWDFCKERWQRVKAWIYDTGPGNVCLQRYQRFHAEHVTKWRRGSLASISRREYERQGLTVPPDRFWEVGMRRGDEYKMVIMPYPRQEYWTDDEIAAVEFVPQQIGERHPVDGWKAEPRDLPGSGEDRDEHDVLDYSVVCSRFSEADCGGAFDGVRVISDADPGL